MLLVGVTGEAAEGSENSSISYATIAGLDREEKRAYLSAVRDPYEYLDLFESMDIDESAFRLRPTEKFDGEVYSRFWRLYEVRGSGESWARRRCSCMSKSRYWTEGAGT